MEKKQNEEFNAKLIKAHYDSYDAQISFLAMMAYLSSEYSDHFDVSKEEIEYFIKKIRLLTRALDVVEQHWSGKCDSRNCLKAINLIDDQIRILEGW